MRATREVPPLNLEANCSSDDTEAGAGHKTGAGDGSEEKWPAISGQIAA